jgi:hypothetical protein
MIKSHLHTESHRVLARKRAGVIAVGIKPDNSCVYDKTYG